MKIIKLLCILLILSGCTNQKEAANKMTIDDINNRFDNFKLQYKITGQSELIKSKLAIDRRFFFLPMSWESLSVYEFVNEQDLQNERNEILKKTKKKFPDTKMIEYILGNIYIIYPMVEGREETLTVLNKIFE
ncbi:hypothetical protein [Paenibacillus sinopodophylli]|uniref:hypothetical protein n=1 Tax=Paenibacillus sinopodophylli TaxID=1837342 RepID=UPI00110CDBF4|nr:hypothetical protein [Paenibacillus sinopodophylli]